MTDPVAYSSISLQQWLGKGLSSGRWGTVLAFGLLVTSCQVENGQSPAEIPPDYQAASDFVQAGFLKKSVTVTEFDGQEVALWGYLDRGNIFENSEQPDYWRFMVKARPDDALGESFSVLVPKSEGYLQSMAKLRTFNAGDQAPIVLLRGTARVFVAPTNTNRLTGLEVELPEAEAFKLMPRD